MNEIEKLKQENAELKAKIKKYAELNEIDTRDYAALHNENIKLNAIIDSYQPRLQALKDDNERLKAEMTELEEKFLTLNGKSYSYYLTLQEIKEYINAQGIDNKWNMRIQRFRSEILQILTKAEE